jgi:glutamine synthetase
VYDRYLDEDTVKMFESTKIMTRTELEARNEIKWETYYKKVQIESRTLGDIAINHIVPTAVSYQNRLIENLCGLKQLFAADEFEVLAEDRKDLIREISTHVTAIKKLVKQMTDDRHKANHESENEEAKAIAYDKVVRPVMEEIRSHIDELELVIDDDIWPLPKYRELLFAR